MVAERCDEVTRGTDELIGRIVRMTMVTGVAVVSSWVMTNGSSFVPAPVAERIRKPPSSCDKL